MSYRFQLSSYDYTLPEEQIAQSPIEPRDASRLMVIHRDTGRWEHRRFTDIVEYLGPEDVLVANNTRVMRARLLGNRVLSAPGEPLQLGGKIEMLLLEKKEEESRPGRVVWEGIFNSAAKQIPGLRFAILVREGEYLFGELIRGSRESVAGTVVAQFPVDPLELGLGELPLPPYIRSTSSTAETSYQTVYAKAPGSAAAPTAGLHFTDRVLENLKEKHARWLEVTLHVGLGTFRPVKSEDIRDHVMHEEKYWMTSEVAEALTTHRRSGGRVLAVGTTSVRALESSYDVETKSYRSGSGSTGIYIYPGGRPICAVDRLLTNFHLPKSTLLMLVSAFASRELILEAYREAVKEKYRFFSYGDAMLIL